MGRCVATPVSLREEGAPVTTPGCGGGSHATASLQGGEPPVTVQGHTYGRAMVRRTPDCLALPSLLCLLATIFSYFLKKESMYGNIKPNVQY